MQLAFILYKYFPFGGLQRDFMRIAQECQARGHAVRVYTPIWEGEVLAGFEVVVVPVKALFNHKRNEKLTAWVEADLAKRPVDRLVGFNKMPGLDVYYAADGCYEDKAQTLRAPIYKRWGRYKHFADYERAVFAPESKTEILMISEVQQPLFIKHYHTPLQRFHLLPPGIAADRRAPANAAEMRAEFRAEFKLADSDLLLVQIGSGFKTKGLDRSLKALAALPRELKQRTRLIAIGQDDPRAFSAAGQGAGRVRSGADSQGAQRHSALPARGRSADPPGLQREHRYRAAGGAGFWFAGAGDRCLRLRPLHRRSGCRAGVGQSVRAGAP